MKYWTKEASGKARPWDYIFISALCVSRSYLRKRDRSFRWSKRIASWLGLFKLPIAKLSFKADVFYIKSLLPFFPFLLIIAVVKFLDSLFADTSEPGLLLFGAVLLGIIVFVLPRMYDWKNIGRITRYFDSAWWNNTDLHPGEVFRDPGLWGEYKATLFVEKALQEKGIYGKIYNRVLIPHYRDGKLQYTEADIVAVSTMGIHVFEVKNYDGIISGSFSEENWLVEYDSGREKNLYNPCYQNQTHINRLIEAIRQSLADAYPFDLENPLFYHTSNVVFFTELSGWELKLSGDPMPGTGVFSSPDDGINGYRSVMESLSEPLTKDEVDLICAAMDSITDYSRAEYEARMAKKIADHEAEMRERKLYPEKANNKPAYYCCARFSDGTYAVARYNGDAIWYDLFGQGLFFAVPEARIQSHSNWYSGDSGYDAAAAIFREKIGVDSSHDSYTSANVL